MARRGIEPMKDEHVNVTPLIDVVMCLIIFFLLVGQMAKDEKLANIDIPRARTPQEVDSEGRLIINVLAKTNAPNAPVDPNMKNGTVPPDVFVRGKNVPLNELTNTLKTEKHDNPDLRIALRADSILDYKFVAPVLISCAQADIESVNFATQLGIPQGNTPSASSGQP